MIEPYILIFISLILSVGNFVLWWLLFNDEFSQRLDIYETAYREQMRRENEEFVAKMGGLMDLDPEAIEVTGFGESWREKLEKAGKLRDEASKTIGHINTRWQEPNKDILRHVFLLLATGQPVSPVELAEVSGYELDDVEEALRLGRTERDAQGRVSELFGVMLSPTLHRIEVNGIVLFSCCPLVAHTVPQLINDRIALETVDPIKRRIVRLSIGRDGVESVHPTEAVATLVRTELEGVLNNVGANFCSHIFHFVSRGSAEEFVRSHSKRYIIELDDFHEVGRRLQGAVWPS